MGLYCTAPSNHWDINLQSDALEVQESSPFCSPFYRAGLKEIPSVKALKTKAGKIEMSQNYLCFLSHLFSQWIQAIALPSTAVLSLPAANFIQGPPLQSMMKRKLCKYGIHSFPKPFIFFKSRSASKYIFWFYHNSSTQNGNTKCQTDSAICKKKPKPSVLSQWSLTFRILPEHSSNIPFVCCHPS